jgi:class 3 adenylate cyclase
VSLEDLGELTLRNVDAPVRTYRVPAARAAATAGVSGAAR